MSIQNGQITAPVSLQADVYAALGLQKTGTYYDIGYICSNRHEQTNKWSRRKSVRVGGPAEITDDQLKQCNFGLDIAGGTFSLPGDALTAAASVDWPYLPPVPGTHWCRLTDWVGYNHNAVQPFSFALTAIQGLQGQYQPKLWARGGRTNDPNAEVQLEEFQDFSNTTTTGWAIVYRKAGQGTAQVYGVDTATGRIDYPLAGNANIDIRADVAEGQWEACICLWMPSRGFVPMPGTYKTVQASYQSSEEMLGVAATVDTYANAASKNRVYQRVTFKNTSGRTVSVQYDYYIYVYDSGGREQGSRHYSGTLSLTNGQTTSLPIGTGNTGGYGLWTDEYGISGATYRYLLQATVSGSGYEIVKEGDVPFR